MHLRRFFNVYASYIKQVVLQQCCVKSVLNVTLLPVFYYSVWRELIRLVEFMSLLKIKSAFSVKYIFLLQTCGLSNF